MGFTLSDNAFARFSDSLHFGRKITKNILFSRQKEGKSNYFSLKK